MDQIRETASSQDHFQAAERMAGVLPYILTREAKRMQQRGILKALLAGLRAQLYDRNGD